MKRIITLTSLLLIFVMLFASCDEAPDAHRHSFAQEWSSDTRYHWQECTAEGCGEQRERGTHDIVTETDGEGKNQKVCGICGYVSQVAPDHEHTFEVRFNEEAKAERFCGRCGYVSDEEIVAPEHEHTFSDKLDANDRYHWYVCTAKDCYETHGRAEHSFGNPETEYADGVMTVIYTCLDCEYVRRDVREVDTTVEDAAEWDNIFENFTLTDFSMYVYTRTEPVLDRGTERFVVTENAVYYCLPDIHEFYSFKNGDGSYSGYGMAQFDQRFVRLSAEEAEKNFAGAIVETAIDVSFEDDFDKFTYDAASAAYISDKLMAGMYYDFDGNPNSMIYLHSSKVRIVDGKVSYISCEFSYGDPNGLRRTFTYFNIGMSKVDIPQSVIDQANGVVCEHCGK